MSSVSVLFVCLGNICRSPTVEAVFRHRVEQEGLKDLVRIDSCGTAAYHIGKSPDARTVAAGEARGYRLSPLRARQLSVRDFLEFDYVLGMDRDNLSDIVRLQSSAGGRATVGLFLEFAGLNRGAVVPDPYYGGTEGFESVLDLAEQGSERLLSLLKERHSELRK